MIAGIDIETQDGMVYCTGAATADWRVAKTGAASLKGITPVVHNGVFDLSYLDPNGECKFWYDTILEAHLLGYRPLALPELAATFLGVSLDKTIVKERKEVRFEERHAETLAMCSLDAWAAYALHDLWKDEVAKYSDILDMERQVSRVLISMKKLGLPINDAKLLQARDYVLREMVKAETVMKQYDVDPLDIQSVARKFWQGKKVVTTESGRASTKKAVLLANMLEGERPWVEAYLLWRQCDKFRSTYIEAWLGKGSVHADLNQTGTATWRFSSSSPNLQNVPRASNIPLYNLFEAPEGHVFISADYSQLELRVMANITGDTNMRQAYLEGRDLHTETERLLSGLGTFDKLGVDPSFHRTFAKTVNFGIAYGMTSYGLSGRLDISKNMAQELIDGFYAAYPGVVPWQREQEQHAARHGYVNTFLGRPIHTPCALSDAGQLHHHGLKQAVNAPIQGGAAEVVKQAMLRCPQYLRMQVHDDLVYVVPENEAEEYKQFLVENLRDDQHDVPYIAEPKMGKTWGEIKDIEDIWNEDFSS